MWLTNITHSIRYKTIIFVVFSTLLELTSIDTILLPNQTNIPILIYRIAVG